MRIARRAPRLFPAPLSVDTALLSNVGQVTGLPEPVGDAGAVTACWGTPPG